MALIGLISDTHGLLRPEALQFLRGCDHIIHGGDIGGPGILAQLTQLAPVSAVRGNNDVGAWASALPLTLRLELFGVRLLVLHDLADIDVNPLTEAIDVIVSGHSHRPSVTSRDGVLYVNPGSAGPRRFRLPIAVGELRLAEGRIEPRWVELPVLASGPA